MTDVPDAPRHSTRAVLVLGILAGLNSATLLVIEQPEQLSLATDVYYYAGQAVLDGGDLYAVTPPDLPGYHYIYPPIVVAAFLPHALAGSPEAAFALQTALNGFAAIGIAIVAWRALARRGVELGRLDRLLVLAFTIASAWSAAQFVMGQVNLPLALGIALGFDWLDRDRWGRSAGSDADATDGDSAAIESTDRDAAAASTDATDRDAVAASAGARAGVAFGLVALVKLFPATIGLWLLRTRRYRAVAAAIATGLGGLVLGAIVFGPDLTVQYLTEVLVDRFEGQTFEGTPDPERNHTTVRRMLAAAFGGSSLLVTPLAFALVLPPVAYCYRTVETDRQWLSALLATLVGTLLVMPLQPLYFSFIYVPALLLAFTLDGGFTRKLLLLGMLCTFVFASPATVASLVGPLPDAIGTALVDAATALFTVILVPTVGMWLLLAACVTVHARDGSTRERTDAVADEDVSAADR